MTTDTDLLRAVCANPGDDTPRLALADWLDENAQSGLCNKCMGKREVPVHETDASDGKRCLSHWRDCEKCRGTGAISNGFADRAEFIRVQVELAGLPEPEELTFIPLNARTGAEWVKATCAACRRVEGDGHCRYHVLRERERELCDHPTRAALAPFSLSGGVWVYVRHGIDWHHIGSEWGPAVSFRRGFVSGYHLRAADWLAHADALVATNPIESVTLTTVTSVEMWPDPDWDLPGGSGTIPHGERLPGDPLSQMTYDEIRVAARRFEGRMGTHPLALLHHRWPGITFELPPVPAPNPFDAVHFLETGEVVPPVV